MKNAIEIKNLNKSFKEFSIKNVSLNVPTGSIVGFIGENGAGKSTTIKLILDLMSRDSGSISVFGNNAERLPKELKEDIGVVMDESCIPDTMTIKDINTIMLNTYKNWDEKVFLSYAEKFNLSKGKKFKDFSRGMKMKLGIAVALSHKSKLLILDEPTSGLDPIVRDEILDIFLDFIQDENHSIFISSHIISDLEKVCDYIVFIHNGKIVFNDQKDKLLEKYVVVKCSNEEYERIDKSTVIGARKNKFSTEALVEKSKITGNLVYDKASIEDIMLYFVKER